MENHKVLMQLLFIFLFCFIPTFSKEKTVTSILPDQFIQYDETLVSSAGNFEAGFFNFGNPLHQYFGIWYKNISPKTIVWVANRDTPLQNSTAIFKLTHQGTLVVLDGTKGKILWSSNSSQIAAKPILQLLDSGNLIVKVENEKLLWQSFDYPGNTLLAGMKIESNMVTGPYKYLTSWTNSEDPSEGEFSYRIDIHGFPQLLTAKGTKIVYRAGSWDGYHFTGVSWQRLQRILNFSFVFTDKKVSYEYETFNSSTITRFVLDSYGAPQRYIWSDVTQNWEATSGRPIDYAFCGNNSNCNINSFPACECLEGFTPKFQDKWDLSDRTGGCVRRTKLNCFNDGFLKYSNIKLPDTSTSWYDRKLNLEECETRCLKNCACTAYANLDVRDGGSGCLLWFYNIVDMRKLPDQGQDIYIRLASSELGTLIQRS